MARKGSTKTEISLRLSEDAVDRNGKARMGYIDPGPSSDDVAIAPWIDVPPTPPPKSPGRTFGGIQPKPSKGSISSFMQGSSSGLSRFARPYDSQATLGVPDVNRGSLDDGEHSFRGLFNSGSSTTSSELRKSKSSLTLNVFPFKLKRSSSKANLTASDGPSSEHPSLRPPAPPLPNASFLNLGDHVNGSFATLPIIKGGSSRKEKKKSKQSTAQREQVNQAHHHQHYYLDTNISDMGGIIKESSRPGFSSPSSGAGSDYGSVLHHPTLSSVEFSDPFPQQPGTSGKRKIDHHHRRVSPKTIPPFVVPNGHRPTPSSSSAPGLNGTAGSPTWVAPESWAVEPEGPEMAEVAGYSSSEEDAHAGVASPPAKAPSMTHPRSLTPSIEPPRVKKHSQVPHPEESYRIRVSRPNGGSHIVTLGSYYTVAELNEKLREKLFPNSEGTTEQHKLYLDEGGRERLLAGTERPANIVKKRLLLAGYEENDGIEYLGSDELPFLFKFSYKSQLLGPPEEELNFENFDFIDLTGRSLRTIPVILHRNADSIISLKLSRNPMLEIPLDFIQSCSLLRELRLSNMAMQKVPQSVRHATTLLRLDISSNRISDLDDAFLDGIHGLMSLSVQNNRLTTLPWHFGRLRSLSTLNISNNRLSVFPKAITQIESLRDLDISFNSITEIPEQIGNLRKLERFFIVGNQITGFPDECRFLTSLRILDCRRNSISDLTIILMLPDIQAITANHNAVHALDLSLGPELTTLEVSHNDITQLSLVPGPIGRSPYSLTSLDLSYAKLSSLDDIALSSLTSLRSLKLDHNSFRVIPDTLGELTWLETLSCSDNQLSKLPSSIGRLQKLEILDAHNNNLSELPQTLWNCASLMKINVTSNFLGFWHDPPITGDAVSDAVANTGRKASTASSTSLSGLPPLVHSLERLYLGENRLTDDSIYPLMIFKELRVLNLSFNEIQELPSNFFRKMVILEELYLSGNKLTSIPTEDLPRLKRLSTLYLNGNRLQTLPQELGKVKDLTILDVGSNLLRYNINNWEFDWNWNFNKKLRYLNLSGNKRLQIKSESSRTSSSNHRISRDIVALGRQTLAGFKDLTALRVLGLMDVTITTTGADASVDIPEDTEMRRVRTSASVVGGMAYGIADSLGRNEALNVLNMLDLVWESPARPGESPKAIFAMFGQFRPTKNLMPSTSPNKVSKFLQSRFIEAFSQHLQGLKKGEGVPDAMRRTFLNLNKHLYKQITIFKRKNSQASGSASHGTGSWCNDPALQKMGASSVVVYVVDKTLYVANVGNALAVVSRQGVGHYLSKKHDPYDREEGARIRAAGGWISSSGLVNDEVDVSRSFGYFTLVPSIRAAPDIVTWPLSDLDEFVIIANRGLWDYVPYQTAVDIARTVASTDPMIAAQKLRDFAISYGADGTVMIMVVMVSDLFHGRAKQDTMDIYRGPKRDDILLKELRHGTPEVDPPTGHLALVFTDIRNSTHLWEVNPGMPTAMRLHNSLLRRHLRRCGGYEVKTEGDAFMVSFPTALAAVWWSLTIQKELLRESWPLEILECEDGKEHHDDKGRLIARGLSVRMGIHSGIPICEPDPITNRMDYFGSMVNRSARVNSSAAGGQIMITADILRELNAKVFETEPESEYSKLQPQDAIDGIRDMGVEVIPVGEVKLKGFEFTEVLSAIYPRGLEARHELKEGPSNSTGSASRVQFSVPQTRELGVLCLRLEALSGGRVFRTPPIRKASIQSVSVENDEEGKEPLFTADPDLLLPPMNEQSSDTDLMLVLDSLSVRIENAINALAGRLAPSPVEREKLLSALLSGGQLDSRTLDYISSVLQNL